MRKPGRRRRLTSWLVAAVLAVILVSLPLRYTVEGPSMAPGLFPGERVVSGPFPWFDRLRRPQRFDRWVLETADGTPAIKRVVGLPGEAVSIAAGDLSIGGVTVLKGPRLLAESGMAVAAVSQPSTAAWRAEPREVLDDVHMAAGHSVLLLPVRDVGFAAIIAVAAEPVRVRAIAGRTAVTWRLASGGRYGIVAGRLDGHAVAAAWPLPRAATDGLTSSCLPPHPPEAWDVAVAWPDGDADDRSPRLELLVEDGGSTAVIECLSQWRDLLLRPAADGVVAWQVGNEAVFVLGDFPAASRDSRHWGAVPVSALRHRVSAFPTAR